MIILQVTMEKMIEMQKKRKEEKPVAMLIKGGMLFKDGKTTEEKKVGDDNHDICPLTKHVVQISQRVFFRPMTWE